MQTNDRTAAAQCKESLQEALREVQSIERRCEKVQGKFPPESSQGSLLKNRFRAIRVAERLLEAALRGETAPVLPREELECAVAPLASIHHKCAAAQEKWEPGTRYYRQMQRMMDAMQTAKELICAALYPLEK